MTTIILNRVTYENENECVDFGENVRMECPRCKRLMHPFNVYLLAKDGCEECKKEGEAL